MLMGMYQKLCPYLLPVQANLAQSFCTVNAKHGWIGNSHAKEVALKKQREDKNIQVQRGAGQHTYVTPA